MCVLHPADRGTQCHFLQYVLIRNHHLLTMSNTHLTHLHPQPHNIHVTATTLKEFDEDTIKSRLLAAGIYVGKRRSSTFRHTVNFTGVDLADSLAKEGEA